LIAQAKREGQREEEHLEQDEQHIIVEKPASAANSLLSVSPGSG
jgi:hypothetical protein